MKYSGFCLLVAVCLASTIRGEAADPQNSLRIAVYESEANAAEYREVHQSPLRAWLQRNSRTPTWTPRSRCRSSWPPAGSGSAATSCS